ncbi:MAG: hypothetical protein ABIH87_01390 [bacterium]
MDKEHLYQIFKDIMASRGGEDDLTEGEDFSLCALDEDFVFHKSEKDAPTRIELDQEISDLMPQSFFDNPTEWIENQPYIYRGEDAKGKLPEKGKMSELVTVVHYDTSKVREVELVDKDEKKKFVLVKRLDEERGQGEVNRSRQAYEAGIPTPKVLGEVEHWGNHYAFFQHVEGINLQSAYDEMYKSLNIVSLDDISFIASSHSEKTVKADIDDLTCLSEQVKDHMYQLWLDNSVNVKKSLLFSHMKGLVVGINQVKIMKERIDSTDEVISHVGNGEDLANQCSVTLGFDNWQDFTNNLLIQAVIGKDKREAFKNKYKKLIDSFSEDFRLESRNTGGKMLSVVEEDFFGFSPTEEMQRIKDLCVAKGITHDDQESRNFVIPWDTKVNKPREPRFDESKLYLIDWKTVSSEN